MTTIEAAAARSFVKPLALAVIAAVTSMSLAGCESSNNLFGSAAEPTPAVANAADPAVSGKAAKIAVAPLLGPPDSVSKMFQSQLTSTLEASRITVAKAPTDKAEYTLRGYLVSANEKAKTKVSYIWDVTDNAGKQVHRISGEETVASGQGKDPWVAVTPQLVDSISKKASASVATWLSTTGGAPAVAGVPVASAAPAAAPAAAPRQAVTAAPAAPAATAQTTGSIGKPEGVNVMVSSVTGAPGDGSVALTNAMQKALTAKGVALTDKATGQTYKVQGKVAVGAAKDGKQPIQIDWELTDPKGKFYKRVTQKNEIPQGMLDGAWGQTADAAAGAAADTLAGLLPKQQQASAAPVGAAPAGQP